MTWQRRLLIELGITPSDDKPSPLSRLVATVAGLAFLLLIFWFVTN